MGHQPTLGQVAAYLLAGQSSADGWSVRKGATHTEIGPGGETQVCKLDEGMYVNGGPWRIPHWHTGVLGYCKELGVPCELYYPGAPDAKHTSTDAYLIEQLKAAPVAKK